MLFVKTSKSFPEVSSLLIKIRHRTFQLFYFIVIPSFKLML